MRSTLVFVHNNILLSTLLLLTLLDGCFCHPFGSVLLIDNTNTGNNALGCNSNSGLPFTTNGVQVEIAIDRL
jgi:hypothetical protein